MPRVKPPEPKRPDWIKVKLNNTDDYREVKRLVKGLKLNTVCEEARCPNIFECWGREKTATFMIMGDICTRRCMFCSVDKGRPGYLDKNEPRHVAEAAEAAGWDAVFLWDHVLRPDVNEIIDPWIAMAAISQARAPRKA